MSATDLLTDSGTLVRRSSSGTDEYGNPDDVDTSTVVRCLVANGNVYLPADVELDDDDRFTYDGETYAIEDGSVERHRHPRSGVETHVSAKLVGSAPS